MNDTHVSLRLELRRCEDNTNERKKSEAKRNLVVAKLPIKPCGPDEKLPDTTKGA